MALDDACWHAASNPVHLHPQSLQQETTFRFTANRPALASLAILAETCIEHACTAGCTVSVHKLDLYCTFSCIQPRLWQASCNLCLSCQYYNHVCLGLRAAGCSIDFQLIRSAFVAGPPAYNPASASPAVAPARPRYSPSQSPERPSTSSSTADVLSFLYDAPGQAQSQQPAAAAPSVAAAGGCKAPLYQPPSQPPSAEASGINAWASQVTLSAPCTCQTLHQPPCTEVHGAIMALTVSSHVAIVMHVCDSNVVPLEWLSCQRQ